MRFMKPVSCWLVISCLLFSCSNNAGSKKTPSFLTGLIPYEQRYPGTTIKDTVFAGNQYLKYMVRSDTADGALYICYGRPGFDSIYIQKDGAPFNCSSWEYAYHTPRSIGLLYECAGGRELLVLPLNTADSVQAYTPLFVSPEDSLLLVEDTRSATGGPALIAADLDFKRRKAFRLSYNIPCADILACFDTIYFNKKLVMAYEAGEEGQEPVTQVQAEAIDWKK